MGSAACIASMTLATLFACKAAAAWTVRFAILRQLAIEWMMLGLKVKG